MSQAQEVFLFQPTSISGCGLWFDAADTSTITPKTSGNVTAWVNKGSISTTATNSVGNCTTGNIFNDLNFIQCPAGTRLIFSCALNTQARTWFVVARNLTQLNTSPQNFFSIGIGQASGSGQDALVGLRVGTNDYRAYNGPTGIAIIVEGQFSENPLNVVNTYCWVNSSSTLSNVFTLNGQSTALTINASVGGFNTGTLNYLINRSDYNTGLDVFEILFYTRNITPEERQRVEGYLSWKWGLQGSLPANHPFKTYRPYANPPFPTIGIPPVPVNINTVEVFVPTQLSGCELWIDAKDSTTMFTDTTATTQANPGQTIARWNDKSANANYLVQNTAANRPTLSNVSTNNPAVYFANATLSLTSINNNATTGNSSRSMFLLQQAPNTISITRVGTGGHASATPPTAFGFDNNTTATARLWTPYVYNASDVTRTIQLRTFSLLYAFYDASTSTLGGGYDFGNILTNSTTLNTTANAWFFGRRPDNSGCVDSYICEFLHYNRVLSTAEINQVEGYLAWKWDLVSSLPDDHPYKNPPIAPFPFRTIPFEGSLSSWVPTNAAGCALWLDGSDTSTMSFSNQFITSWTDKISSRVFTTGFSNVTAPTFSNGGVFFNPASNQGLRASNTDFPLTSNFSIFIAHNLVARANNNTLLSFTTNVNTGYMILGNNTTNTFRTLYRPVAGTSGGFDYSDAVANTYSMSLYSLQNSNLSLTRSFNTVPWATTTVTSYFAAAIPIIDIGFIQAATGPSTFIYSRFQNGFINEILIYDLNISIAERQQIEGYLAWKWGFQARLPGNHPFKFFPPSPV